MLDLILGNNVLLVIAVVVIGFLVITLFTLIGQYEAVRWVIGIPVLAALVFSAFYSYGQINSYYSAKGGIYGAITDLIQTNKTDTELNKEELTHTFKNFNLTKDEKGYYSVKKNDTTIFNVNKDEFYICYVNGYPTEVVNQVIGDDDSKFIFKFSYIFFDYDDNANLVPIADDTIQIEYSFFKTNTEILIKTSCNEEVYGLWNSFFNKNNFEITFKKASEEIASKQELVTITLMVQDEVYSTIKLKQGSNYILPTKIELEGYTFNGFEINGEKVEILRNIQNDMTISANMVFEKSIKEAEFYILKNLDLISGSFENFEELSEYDFYKELYSNIFKDYAEYEIEYYKISLVEMLRLNVTEDSTFTDYLQEMCKYIIKK